MINISLADAHDSAAIETLFKPLSDIYADNVILPNTLIGSLIIFKYTKTPPKSILLCVAVFVVSFPKNSILKGCASGVCVFAFFYVAER